jgi:hypothetical protein
VVDYANMIQEPALLLTCKLIRQEAIGIFYAENKFMADTPGFDPRAYLLLRRKIISLLENYGCRIPMRVCISVRGPPCWRNLLAWLKRFHAGIFPPPMLGEGFARENSIREAIFVMSMFRIAAGARGQPWHEVEGILFGLRGGLKALHRGWR